MESSVSSILVYLSLPGIFIVATTAKTCLNLVLPRPNGPCGAVGLFHHYRSVTRVNSSLIPVSHIPAICRTEPLAKYFRKTSFSSGSNLS